HDTGSDPWCAGYPIIRPVKNGKPYSARLRSVIPTEGSFRQNGVDFGQPPAVAAPGFGFGERFVGGRDQRGGMRTRIREAGNADGQSQSRLLRTARARPRLSVGGEAAAYGVTQPLGHTRGTVPAG